MLDSISYVGMDVSTIWFFFKPPLIGIEKRSP